MFLVVVKKNKSSIFLEKRLVRWRVANIILKRDGFTFLYNIRFRSPADKMADYPTLEEEYQRHEERYGQGNFRFEEAVTDRFGGGLPEEKYYRAVYVKSSRSLVEVV